MAKAAKKVKQKTLSGAAKRFKVTGTGKVRFRRANRNHGNTKYSTKQMRKARVAGVMCKADEKLAQRMLCVKGG